MLTKEVFVTPFIDSLIVFIFDALGNIPNF